MGLILCPHVPDRIKQSIAGSEQRYSRPNLNCKALSTLYTRVLCFRKGKGLPSKPAFDDISPVFCFPLFQQLVVTTLGLDNFAIVRAFVLLNLALTTGSFLSDNWSNSTEARVGIQQVNYISQTKTVLS